MLKKMYCIKDELAGIWSGPFVLNAKTAERTFAYMAKERSEQDCKDQMIYMMGWFDDDLGVFEMQAPEQVYDLEAGWRKAHEN